MPQVTARQEVEFYEQFVAKPHDYDAIHRAREQGIISENSRGRNLRRLNEVLRQGDHAAVWYNYRTGEWQASNERGLSQYSTNAASHDGWENKIVRLGNQARALGLSNATGTMLSSDGGVQVSADIQLNNMFGVEWEVQRRTDIHTNSRNGGVYHEISNLLGGDSECVIKSDTSVGEYGFEVVTCPMTYHDAKRKFNTLFNSGVVEKLTADERCGMHVHVSRASMLELEACRLFYFMHHEGNTEFLRKVGDRPNDGNRYCRFRQDILNNNNVKKPTDIYVKDCYADFSDHNDALSYSRRHPTFEFRIFNGTVNKAQFFSNLEFVAAICQFVKSVGHSNPCKYQDFVDWVADPYNWSLKEKDRKSKRTLDKHPVYPYLYTNLKKLGYV